jgi:hypothetical protein
MFLPRVGNAGKGARGKITTCFKPQLQQTFSTSNSPSNRNKIQLTPFHTDLQQRYQEAVCLNSELNEVEKI